MHAHIHMHTNMYMHMLRARAARSYAGGHVGLAKLLLDTIYGGSTERFEDGDSSCGEERALVRMQRG